MGCVKLHILDEQYKRTELKVSCFNIKLTSDFCSQNARSASLYSFNGKERDTEGLGGSGSTYDYGFRIYNPNIAKFLSVDPLTKDYPWYTPYQFAGNKPIWAIDLDGLEEAIVTQKFYDHGLGKLYTNITKDEELTKIWNSVNREDKVKSHRVYYGVITPSERGKNLGGYTVDLSATATFLDYYNRYGRIENASEDIKKEYTDYKNLFETNNIDVKEVLKCGKKVYGIFLDPTREEKEGTYNFLHEIAAHLRNRINDIFKSEKREHSEFHNYKGNSDLLKKYPNLENGGYSPYYQDIPESSEAGGIKDRVEEIFNNRQFTDRYE